MKSLVALHAGQLTVQSRLDEGTTVTVVLPLAFSRPPEQQQASKVATLTPASRSSKQEPSLQVKKSA